MSIPPAWHPDPTGRHDHRWWDGTRWTEHVADAGVSAVDPIEQGGQPGTAGGAGAAGAVGGAGTTQGGTPSDDERAAGAYTSGADQGVPGQGPAPDQGTGGWGSPAQTGASGGTWGGAQPATGGQGWPAGPTGQQAPGDVGRDGLAISAGVIGIVSVVLAVFIIGGLGGIVAIVLGGVAMSRVKKSGRRGRGMAITGLVTGIVAVVLAILMFGFLTNLFKDFDRCVEFTGDPQNCREMTDLFGTADLRVG